MGAAGSPVGAGETESIETDPVEPWWTVPESGVSARSGAGNRIDCADAADTGAEADGTTSLAFGAVSDR